MINRILMAALVTAPVAESAAQLPITQPDRATFVATMAGDTLAVERVTRTSTRVEAELALRGQGAILQLTLALAPDGLVSSMDLAVRLANASAGAPPVQAGSIDFRGDSALLEMRLPQRLTQRVATGTGALPFVNLSMASAEQMVRRARALGGRRVAFPVLALAGAQVLPAVVTWTTPDTAVISLGGVDLRAAIGPDGRVLGAIVPAQSVTFTRVEGWAASLSIATPPDYTAPPDAPYTAEEVTVRSTGGVTLAGTLTLPKARSASGRVPAAVLITGSGPQNRDEELPGIQGYQFFRQIADTLSRRGVAVLRLDDRGIGGSQAGEKPGTTGDFADDIRAALAYLRNRPEIHPGRLALVGHSEGGIIAPLVARDDPQLRAIALLAAPSRSIRKILEFQRRVAVEDDTTIVPAQRDSAIAALGRLADSVASTPGWLSYIYDYDPLVTARRVRQPVLILHGATDLQVTADQTPELSSAFREGGNRDVTVRVFPNTNHLFLEDPKGVYSGYATLPSKRVSPEILGVLADWLVDRLGR